VTLVACGKSSRAEVMAYFQGLFRTLNRVPSNTWKAWPLAVRSCVQKRSWKTFAWPLKMN